MIDHLLGRPSASWKRTQVALVLLFWAWRLRAGNPRGPPGLQHFNERLKRFTPWQIILTALTTLYGVRHWDTLLGLQAPEPLARLYSRGFYRASWINTALDAGFSTAAGVRIKWMRDVLSLLFSGYYLVYANEADEKLRQYRAVPTVEILRVTWEKTSNPFVQFFTRKNRPNISIRRKFILPRPSGSKYTKPITCWLYFARPELDLVRCRNLIMDVPGGGFIAMSPMHHEDRLIRWTMRTGVPILSIDYCKAPEYPFPYAIHECMDVYRLVQETKGRVIGMGRDAVDVILTGDSAGANLSAAMMISMIEAAPDSPFFSLPPPVGILWMYPALDFNFTSWMSEENLRVLRHDSSVSELPGGILEAKNHLEHQSPLSVVADRPDASSSQGRRRHGRNDTLRKSFANLPSKVATWTRGLTPKTERRKSEVELRISQPKSPSETESSENDPISAMSRGQSISERILYHEEESPGRSDSVDIDDEMGDQPDVEVKPKPKTPKAGKGKKAFGTRLTMTSRTGFFNDRIISPSMMRCMAICYIGPRNAPDLTKDYHISPIFAPASVLARFPPVYLVCGEKDPFVDDTVIIAGKIREAKRARKRDALTKAANNAGQLRKSAATRRDPILDEAEADWVQLRIFEGWSHGFAQMLPLLPEVSSALDLTADFITSAFTKHEAKSQGELKPPIPLTSAYKFVSERKTDTSTVADDDALSFTPRRRPRGGSDSRSNSPSPGTLAGGSAKVGNSGLRTVTPTPPPGFRLSTDSSASSPDTSVSGAAPLVSSKAASKSLIGFNAASAAAIVTPPVLVTPTVETLPVRKEGKILDNHEDLFDRRREEAGYGLPEIDTPEEHFRPLRELSVPTSARARTVSDEVLQGQYVGEEDLLERRRLQTTYGLTHPDELAKSGADAA
ncbi:hormone-sensitive lipase [Melampsora larici-populina 98AG31]|uniref:Hormone-sensitive lipase n=1 Tax=Melampsora larici-populina (strain 98AG31 / pathotype 3-4-7) TaxID=747676 RepID=F4RKV6_MELLP|nr:hormone-sensitive lipase [Melampsora larici-populina 98AG31]EGG06792.1 hormone-sensitive lipase [Melampsora larici-populina 98AG31]